MRTPLRQRLGGWAVNSIPVLVIVGALGLAYVPPIREGFQAQEWCLDAAKSNPKGNTLEAYTARMLHDYCTPNGARR